MKPIHQILLLSTTIIAFTLLPGCKVNKIHCGAFNTFVMGDKGGNYVVLKDGQKIYGQKISWQNGLLLKDVIKIDEEKYKIKETRGFRLNGQYYGSLGNDYAKRIIAGKLNVYYTQNTVEVASTNSRTGATSWRSREVCAHYVQVGDEGELKLVASQKDIIRYIKDCPEAVALIDKKNSQIRKAIRKNRNYLNDIFHLYNRGCK